MSGTVESPEVRIRAFREEDAPAFDALNREWISAYFEVEDKDREILENPRTHVLEPGGAIFVAERDAEVIGVVAMIPKSQDTVELAKMTVATSARRLGVARRLAEALFDEARSRGYSRVFLESHSCLQEALRLYESLGFQHAVVCESLYARCDVQMERSLP